MNIINDLIKDLDEKFKKIKKQGWIKSDHTKNLFKGNAGTTFEKLIGITPNELEIPDYNGIEIKTKYSNYNNYISLFNCVPEGPHYHEIERLKEVYGYPDLNFNQFNVLNCAVYATEIKKVGFKNYFKLKVDQNSKKIFLLIYDHNKNLLEDVVYWSFDTLKEKLYRKTKFLAFVKVKKKINFNYEFFKYTEINFYKLKDFDTFIKLIENGIIRISFKIGIFKSEKKLGRIHDHGTSFSIKDVDLLELYDIVKII